MAGGKTGKDTNKDPQDSRAGKGSGGHGRDKKAKASEGSGDGSDSGWTKQDRGLGKLQH